MHGLALVITAALGSVVIAQQKPRFEQLEEFMKDTLQAMTDLREVLNTITHTDSFARARVMLERRRRRLQGITARSERLGKPTREEDEELKKKYEKKIKDTTLQLREEYRRLKDTMPELIEYLDSLAKKPEERKP